VQDGYQRIPRLLFDRMLIEDFSKRELKALLLIARLTYGCRDAAWVRLRPSDLRAIGISSNNVKAVLKPLIDRQVLQVRGEPGEYRINAAYTAEVTKEGQERRAKLRFLIGCQLQRPSQIENMDTHHEKDTFSKQEPSPSQNENSLAGERWTFCLTRQQFIRVDDATIDNI
jgi:hypothetical protein